MYNVRLHVKVQCKHKAANNHTKVHNIISGSGSLFFNTVTVPLAWSLDGEHSLQCTGRRSISELQAVRNLVLLVIAKCKTVALHYLLTSSPGFHR